MCMCMQACVCPLCKLDNHDYVLCLNTTSMTSGCNWVQKAAELRAQRVKQSRKILFSGFGVVTFRTERLQERDCSQHQARRAVDGTERWWQRIVISDQGCEEILVESLPQQWPRKGSSKVK